MTSIPPLAGLASYDRAAQPGYSVEKNVKLFLRYAWIEKRLMETGLYWLASTPEWEVKEALGLHLSLDAEHAASIRKRVGEMRNPVPRMDVSPDPALDRLFDEVLTATDTLAKIVALYDVLRPALLAAYQTHYTEVNPVIDHPTWRMIKHILVDQAEARAMAWRAHLHTFLHAAGGISGELDRREGQPLSRGEGPFEPDFFPQRDDRFAQRWKFANPQRQVSLDEKIPLDERTIALMCRRVVEMDVPEYMTRIIAETDGEPWEYYVAMTRQLWDEVRHAMLGEIYFESRGVDWKALIAIHPGMAIRLGTLDIKEAHNVLFAIEQNLIPASTGKKLEYEISVNAEDDLAAMIQDYDWADEVLHVHTGRAWLLPKLAGSQKEAVERGWALRGQTVHALDEYARRGEQVNWWPAFVKAVLGRETAMAKFDLARR